MTERIVLGPGAHAPKKCDEVHRGLDHPTWDAQFNTEELHPAPMGLQKTSCLSAHPGRRHNDWLERELDIASLAQSERTPVSTYELIEALEEQDPADWLIKRTETWLKTPDRAGSPSSSAHRKSDHEELVVLQRGSSLVGSVTLSGGPRWNEWWVREVKISDGITWQQARKVYAACNKLGISVS
jgi:hypothetical protein